MKKLSLINSKMIEKNNICLMLSLYLYTFESGESFFSFYSDYLGFGIKTSQMNLKDLDSSQFRNLLSGFHIDKSVDMDHLEQRKRELITKMDNMGFDEAFEIISKYQNTLFV